MNSMTSLSSPTLNATTMHVDTARKIVPKPTPRTHAVEPHDQVQLATPEQAAKVAALHPILDPAVQFALVTGFMLAAGNAQGSAIPLVTVDASLQAMGQQRNMTYTIDLKNEENPISTGAFGGPSTDNLTAPAKGPMVYTGPNGTRLKIDEDTKTKAITLTGKLEGYDTNLTVKANPPQDPDDDMQGFHTEGTIGGQKFTMDSAFDIDPSTRPPKPAPKADDGKGKGKAKPAQPDAHAKADPAAEAPPKPVLGRMRANIDVGGQTSQKMYNFIEQEEPFGVIMNLNGGGEVGATRQDANVKLTLVA